MPSNQITSHPTSRYGNLLDKLHKWKGAKENKPKIHVHDLVVDGHSQPSNMNRVHGSRDLKKRNMKEDDTKPSKKMKLADKTNKSLPCATVKPFKQTAEVATEQKVENDLAKETAKFDQLKNKLEEWRKKKAEEKEVLKQSQRAAFVPSSSKIKPTAAQSLPRVKTSGTLPTKPSENTMQRRETFCIVKPVAGVPISRTNSSASVSKSRGQISQKTKSGNNKARFERGFISQSSTTGQRRQTLPVNSARPVMVTSKQTTSSKVPPHGATTRRSPRLNLDVHKSKSCVPAKASKFPTTRQSIGVFHRVPSSVHDPARKSTNAGIQRVPFRLTPYKPRPNTHPSPAPRRNTMHSSTIDKKPQRRMVVKNETQVKPVKQRNPLRVVPCTKKVGNTKQSAEISSKLRRCVSAPAVKNKTKIVPRKSILKTPHKDAPEHKPTPYPDVEEKGTGVRFNIPFTPNGTACGSHPGTPVTGSQRKSTGLTPLMARRDALNAWLVAKGKTPTRFRHLCCFDEHLSAKKKQVAPISGLDVHELTQQQDALDSENILAHDNTVKGTDAPPCKLDTAKCLPPIRDPLADITDHTYHGVSMRDDVHQELNSMLEECTGLFDVGCPAPSVLGWLDDIAKYFKGATSTAAYWICRAKIVEELDDDHMTVDIYEQACRNNAQPAEQVAEALKQFVIRMDERNRATKMASRTPHKRRSGVEEKNMFQSSSIKYCITNTTPFFKKLHKCADQEESALTVITPVRRSTRRSNINLPIMLRDHDVIVDTLDDIPLETRPSSLFMANNAIEDEKQEVVVEEILEVDGEEWCEEMENKENLPPLVRDLSQEFEEVENDNCDEK